MKNTKGKSLFYHFTFLVNFFPCQIILVFIEHFVWSSRFFRYPYYHIFQHIMSYDIYHKPPFYDILWHMPYDITCHKIWQYGYKKNRLDQTKWSMTTRIIWQEQNLTKNVKKTEIKIFPLYFWMNSFVNFKCKFR